MELPLTRSTQFRTSVNSGEEIVSPIKERVKALLSAIEETVKHLRGLGFDGRHVENVMVFNAEQLDVPDTFAGAEVQELKIHRG